MFFDAVVLAGGRGSRLGGVRKGELRRGDDTLLDLALRAVAGSQKVVVVGDAPPTLDRMVDVTVVREVPPFSGPVAAIAAGLRELASEASGFTIVLACDIPESAAALAALQDCLERQEGGTTDGVVAVDLDHRDQYLLAIYSTQSLSRSLSSMVVSNASMKELVGGMNLERVAVPPGSTDDVDTWQDAAGLGVTR